jgi:hypothetical protein
MATTDLTKLEKITIRWIAHPAFVQPSPGLLQYVDNNKVERLTYKEIKVQLKV